MSTPPRGLSWDPSCDEGDPSRDPGPEYVQGDKFEGGVELREVLVEDWRSGGWGSGTSDTE